MGAINSIFFTSKLALGSLPRRHHFLLRFAGTLLLNLNSNIGMRLTKMEKFSEGISDFEDFRVVLFRANDGRHFVR